MIVMHTPFFSFKENQNSISGNYNCDAPLLLIKSVLKEIQFNYIYVILRRCSFNNVYVQEVVTHFYIVSYYMKLVTTSWTYSRVSDGTVI